ncbi:hypothetical protein PVK64_12355 [Aliivibrio sp. S4TY2]|uniref:ABC-three component system protein n=1 Tax=unclassified Aliivibrio TaxID=2645654 RepID=UPI002379B4F8|nr:MULTISPECIES: ABC-three component system protein [unclassified Aliivibrio]MDD9156968.1 hypothetical protein [Aliivibrio sp. S4TY2]MDD9160818.1 hypothetical protein [Aliivibrio sp. S4TY1]MDD9164847.1 hypothetical protein [Aliivibrio sp. S4MY2]MDD9168878.1 hypothetical protein [Aliivibrio sp. S4MY4]MDD9185406.1 hypothetical protein [Aliivibrio sp. S4MY3]
MRKNLVLFIHGLTGGTDTWKNSNSESFSDLLMRNEQIKEKFDFMEFEYFTKIVNVKNSMISQGLVKLVNYVPGVNFKGPQRKKNVSFMTLSEELATFIQFDCNEYSNILIVAHSMGGLIGKKFILDLNSNNYDDIQSEVLGYISLATPHKGSIPAALFGKVNVNLKELGPLSKEVSDVNDCWVENIESMPNSRYVIAKNDDYVNQISSVPSSTNKKKFKSFLVDHDHTSICKPESVADLSLKIVEKFILETIQEIDLNQSLKLKYDPSLNSYDKEIFVVKMLLAQIDDKLIDDAKESFFYADVILKSAPKKDRDIFDDLKIKVLSMYKTYSSCSSNKSNSEVVQYIHKKIIELDKSAIDCVLQYVSFIHKKGLLHHESNKKNLKVNWCKSIDLEQIHEEIKTNA